MNKTALLLPGLLLTPWFEALAAIIYTTPGSSYSQDFDSLPITPENASIQASIPWTDDTTSSPTQTSIPGWYLYHPTTQATEGGANQHQRLRIGAGTTNVGSFWSFGVSGTTERALGSIGSNTMAPVGSSMYIGLRLTNQTGVVLDSFTLSYNGEQWRDGGVQAPGTPTAQSMTFMWSSTATAISDPDSSFAIVPTLGFTSPVFANAAGGNSLDGNDPFVGRVAISGVTVTGINWLPGTDLWLRWADMNDANNDHGLAIDDVSFFAAVPEPGSLGMIAFAMIVILRRPRSK